VTAVDPRAIPVRFSNLKSMGRSPVHYLHRISTRFEPSKPMRIGTLVHHAVLGAAYDDEENEIVTYDGERRGNAWKDFKAAHEGAEIFTTTEHEGAAPIARALMADEGAMNLLRGDRERHIAWKIGDRACSSRLDVLGKHKDGAAFVCDLKTSTTASPGDFMRQAFRMGYHAQLSFYMDAAHAIGVDVGEAYLVVVETVEPYPVTTFRLTKRLLDEGRRTYRAWLERLLVCESSKDWPPYAISCVDFDVPSWMTDAFEDDGDDEGEANDNAASGAVCDPSASRVAPASAMLTTMRATLAAFATREQLRGAADQLFADADYLHESERKLFFAAYDDANKRLPSQSDRDAHTKAADAAE